jgi:hypothetical protein
MRRLLIVCLCLILIIACSENAENKPKAVTLKSEAEKFFRFNNKTVVNVVPSGTPGQSNLEITYPYISYNPKNPVSTMTNPIANMLDGFFKLPRTVDRVKITVRDGAVNGPVIGTFEITQQDFKAVRKNPSYFTDIEQRFAMDNKYLIQSNLLSIAKTAKDVEARRNETNQSMLHVSFKLDDSVKPRPKSSPLEGINVFEELMASIVRTVFESDDSVSHLTVSADLAEPDPRQNSTSWADLSISREDFIAIDERWDSLRYKLFERIDYTQLALLDYTCDSAVESLEQGTDPVAYLYDDRAFKTIDMTVSNVEKDAAGAISRVFAKNPAQSVTIHSKVKLPAKDGKVSSDGIHQIVEDFLVVRADRQTYDSLNVSALSNQQLLYNFEPEWNSLAKDLKIRSDLFTDKDHFRAIRFTSDADVEIDLDSCVLTKDTFMKGKIATAITQIKAGNSITLEETVYDLMKSSATKLVFEIHPPFVESVTFNLQRVYKDSTGNEIEVKDLGSISFTKQTDANYWFQTLPPDELEWVIESSDSLDISDDEVLCQS